MNNIHFDAAADQAANKLRRRAEANRAACLAECSETLDHRANVDQALATVHGHEAQLAALDPERLSAEARIELRTATASGNKDAAAAAAAKIQAIATGAGPEALERITIAAALDAAREDVEACRVSQARAEDAALKNRRDALTKDIPRAIKGYQDVAQLAFDRWQILRALVRKQQELSAAIKTGNLDANYQPEAAGASEIVLPPVWVPEVGTIRAVGRRT